MPKYTAFYVGFKSITEAEAIRAALESKGFEVDKDNLHRAKLQLSGNEKHYANIGNRKLDEITGNRVGSYGYGVISNHGMVRLNGIAELVAFLDSGKHIVPEEKEYFIIETRTFELAVKAKDAEEAMKKAQQGSYIVTASGKNYMFRDENWLTKPQNLLIFLHESRRPKRYSGFREYTSRFGARWVLRL